MLKTQAAITIKNDSTLTAWNDQSGGPPFESKYQVLRGRFYRKISSLKKCTRFDVLQGLSSLKFLSSSLNKSKIIRDNTSLCLCDISFISEDKADASNHVT